MSTGASTLDLRLAEHPSGFYGEALKDDAVVRLNILPPAYLWAGHCPLKLDPRMWQVFADGELLGCIERDEDVGPALLPLLAAGRPQKPHSRSYNTEQQ